MNSFQNKLALITGGSSGMGLALAKKLAALGANVWILARRPEVLSQALSEISQCRVSEHQSFGSIQADVTDAAAVTPAVEQFIAQNGVPDLLVNSAGQAHPGKFEELPLDIFRWMMDLNYFGIVHVTHAAAPGMMARHSGTIVNISSMSGFLGVYGYTAYSAAKFAVRGFSDVLRSEMKQCGVHVSLVFPPNSKTPAWDYENQFKPAVTKEVEGTGGFMSPEAIADAIIKGIQHNRYIITPGLESTLFYKLSLFLGDLVYPVMDLLTTNAFKNEARKNSDAHPN
jgi:3-dehydrosphinganine reductase